ncbi:1-acyl-sn-glycerol-3-phosphate acyltransferase [Paracoccus sp. SCSIO 75233]|uniref:lysophospholipid acyltransferase family protein n=1 Tax=Paracoccus sp. SCSIO 75233 TaxID=3017782 RepID=UPI0022F12B04|nr:lysophospholipid acyltransferase family protein [Paracoccus sp. SCSIO 75233]WBU53413.1 lysophospholipid acyltransferase family protein [Paracoccus sp. SCSIO 75233]
MSSPLLNETQAARLSPIPGKPGFLSYLGTITYYIHVALATIVVGLWGVTKLGQGRRGVHRVATVWIGYMLRAARWHMGVAVEIRGTPPAANEGALIGAKHQSFLDILAIAYAARRRAFVMKREVLRVPIMGWYARRAGCIPIDRSKGRDAMGQIIATVRERMASDEGLGHLILYPEGTRTRPGEKRPYKHGISTLHIETGLPVWPVAVNCGMFWPKRGLPVLSGRAVIEFLEPMQAEPGESRDAFLQRIRDVVEETSEKLMTEAGLQIGH